MSQLDLDIDFDREPEELSKEAAEGEVETLREEIRRHDYLYYVKAEPEISDAEYDRLYRRLEALEETYPDLVTDDSPTRRVGAEPVDHLPTVAHAAPMLSLDSTQEEDEVRRFDERVRKAVGNGVRYLVEPKLDGASMELVYEDGSLDRAVTRGNGEEGEGVTENAKTIPSLPLRLRVDDRPAPEFLSVRGEVLMFLSDFEDLNQRLMEKGSDAFANPRNAAAGAIRQLDPRITAERPLQIFCYEILAVQGVELEADDEAVEALREWGFQVPERIELVDSIDAAIEYHRRYEDERDDLDYEIDGVVIKLNDLAARPEMGATSKHPRWALAYKFEPRKEVTRVEKIVVSVGRTGVLTPVALLRPVEVGGVTVSRASLHNREEVERKGVKEGDRVRIQRAGDVIPQVVERVEEGDGETFRMPDRCPACGTEVVEDGPRTRCPNRFECPAQLKGRIVHFGSRGALDIEGLGEETAALLVDRELVTELADLFDLTAEQLRELPRFAEKSATNLAEALDEARSVELRRFLYGLGIPEVGSTVARDLARHFGSFEEIREAGRDELESVDGVGPKMSEKIRSFFQDERNARAVDHILEKGIDLREPESDRDGLPLEGLKVVFTGGLDRFTRSEAKELVEEAGGRVTSSVSGETDYVVAGEDPGSKHDEALELGVRILDEEGFLELLRDAGVEVPG